MNKITSDALSSRSKKRVWRRTWELEKEAKNRLDDFYGSPTDTSVQAAPLLDTDATRVSLMDSIVGLH